MAASVDEIEELQDGLVIYESQADEDRGECGESERSDVGDLWHDAVLPAVLTLLAVVDRYADPEGRCHEARADQ